MRFYYIVSGILLILPINFVVAAPMLAQERLEADVDVAHMPEDAMTMLGKRAGEFDTGKLFQELFGDTESESFAIPEETATLPSSSSQPSESGPAGGSMTVEKPQPSISVGPSQVSSPDRAPQSAYGGLKKLWLTKWQNKNIIDHPESHSFINPDESSVTSPSSSPQLSGPDDGSMAVKNLLPSASKETSQVSSPSRAPTDDGLRKMWLNIIGYYPENLSFPKRVKLSGSQPSGVDGSIATEKPVPSVSKEPSLVSSSDSAPLSADDGMMKMWLDIINDDKSLSSPKRVKKLSTKRPSLSSQPPGPADGSIAVGKPLPSISKEPSLVSSSGGAPTDDGLMKMWLSIIGQPENLSSSKRVKKGKKPLKKPVPSISKEPSLVSSSESDRAPLSADDGMKKMWPDIINHDKSLSSPKRAKLSATRPSLSSQPPVPADGSIAVGKSLPSVSKESSLVSSSESLSADNGMKTMWLDIVGHVESIFSPKRVNPLPSISKEPLAVSSSPSRMDGQPSSPVLSTNPDSQWMGTDSSSRNRKRP